MYKFPGNPCSLLQQLCYPSNNTGILVQCLQMIILQLNRHRNAYIDFLVKEFIITLCNKNSLTGSVSRLLGLSKPAILILGNLFKRKRLIYKLYIFCYNIVFLTQFVLIVMQFPTSELTYCIVDGNCITKFPKAIEIIFFSYFSYYVIVHWLRSDGS